MEVAEDKGRFALASRIRDNGQMSVSCKPALGLRGCVTRVCYTPPVTHFA